MHLMKLLEWDANEKKVQMIDLNTLPFKSLGVKIYFFYLLYDLKYSDIVKFLHFKRTVFFFFFCDGKLFLQQPLIQFHMILQKWF